MILENLITLGNYIYIYTLSLDIFGLCLSGTLGHFLVFLAFAGSRVCCGHTF